LTSRGTKALDIRLLTHFDTPAFALQADLDGYFTYLQRTVPKDHHRQLASLHELAHTLINRIGEEHPRWRKRTGSLATKKGASGAKRDSPGVYHTFTRDTRYIRP